MNTAGAVLYITHLHLTLFLLTKSVVYINYLNAKYFIGNTLSYIVSFLKRNMALKLYLQNTFTFHIA